MLKRERISGRSAEKRLQSDSILAVTKKDSRRLNQLSRLSVIEHGVIQDVLPVLRLYRVALEAGPIIICSYAGDCGFSFFGVQDHTTLPAGTTVHIVRTSGAQYGTIFSVEPELLTVPGAVNYDEVVTASNTGFISDSFQRAVLAYQPPRGGGLPAWVGSHRDSLPGEWVKMTETGIALSLDSMMGAFRVNEYCGLWLHYLDSLLRLAGLNFQLWAGGSEVSAYTDWVLCHNYAGYSYLLRDQLGWKSSIQDPLSDGTDEFLKEFEFSDVDNAQKRVTYLEHKAVIEGETNKFSRFPKHIVQNWEGLLGQGGMRWVMAHPASYEAKQMETHTIPRAVAQFGITRDGFILGQSVNGILLAKYPFIPVSVKMSDVDEGIGIPSTEKFSERVKLFFEDPDLNPFNQDSVIIKCTHIFDIHNILCNWEAHAGFYLYPKKFHRVTEKDIKDKTFHKKGVQLRRGTRSAAFIYIDPKGDIIIQNGGGARLELVGPDARITAPRNVYLDSGNRACIFGNTVTVIGYDQIQNTSFSTIQHLVMSGNSVSSLLGLTSGAVAIPNGTLYVRRGNIRDKTSSYVHYCPRAPELTVPAQPWIYHYRDTDDVDSGQYWKATFTEAVGIHSETTNPIPRTFASEEKVSKMPSKTDDEIEQSTDSLFGEKFSDIQENWTTYSEIYVTNFELQEKQ